jgi:hypothetical protein
MRPMHHARTQNRVIWYGKPSNLYPARMELCQTPDNQILINNSLKSKSFVRRKLSKNAEISVLLNSSFYRHES